jgi:hypothetical protein
VLMSYLIVVAGFWILVWKSLNVLIIEFDILRRFVVGFLLFELCIRL